MCDRAMATRFNYCKMQYLGIKAVLFNSEQEDSNKLGAVLYLEEQ